MNATIPRLPGPAAAVTRSYPISHGVVVRALGAPSRLSIVDGGGESAHYQREWGCGCVVRELERRYRIAPCASHRQIVTERRDASRE